MEVCSGAAEQWSLVQSELLLVLPCKVTRMPVSIVYSRGVLPNCPVSTLNQPEKKGIRKAKTGAAPRTICNSSAHLVCTQYRSSKSLEEELNLFFICFEAASLEVTTLHLLAHTSNIFTAEKHEVQKRSA